MLLLWPRTRHQGWLEAIETRLRETEERLMTRGEKSRKKRRVKMKVKMKMTLRV